jgi:hypothetical protein
MSEVELVVFSPINNICKKIKQGSILLSKPIDRMLYGRLWCFTGFLPQGENGLLMEIFSTSEKANKFINCVF